MITALASLKAWINATLTIDRWTIMPPDTVADGQTALRPPTSAFFETSDIQEINRDNKYVRSIINVSIMYRFLASTPYNNLPIPELSALQSYMQWLYISSTFVNSQVFDSTPKPIEILKERVTGDTPDTIIKVPLAFGMLAAIEVPTGLLTPSNPPQAFVLNRIDGNIWKSPLPGIDIPGSYKDTTIQKVKT